LPKLTRTNFLARHEAAAQGQAWFAASGDLGAYDCGNYSSMGVDYPASDPNVTAVGGTTLTLTSTGAISTETVWSMSGGGLSGAENCASHGMNVCLILELLLPRLRTRRECSRKKRKH